VKVFRMQIVFIGQRTLHIFLSNMTVTASCLLAILVYWQLRLVLHTVSRDSSIWDNLRSLIQLSNVLRCPVFRK